MRRKMTIGTPRGAKSGRLRLMDPPIEKTA